MFLLTCCMYSIILPGAGRETSKLFMLIFKLFRKNNGKQGCLKTPYPCLLMLISFLLVPHSISKHLKAEKSHHRIQMEKQLNAKKTERESEDGNVYTFRPCHCIDYWLHSQTDCSPNLMGRMLKYTGSSHNSTERPVNNIWYAMWLICFFFCMRSFNIINCHCHHDSRHLHVSNGWKMWNQIWFILNYLLWWCFAF